MKCKKCNFDGNPHLVVTGPHTKALCPECGAFIKMTTKQERESAQQECKTTQQEYESTMPTHNRIYKYTSDMVKAAHETDYQHVGGYGFECKHCKHPSSVRKFVKVGEVIYCCPKCGARWGNLIPLTV